MFFFLVIFQFFIFTLFTVSDSNFLIFVFIPNLFYFFTFLFVLITNFSSVQILCMRSAYFHKMLTGGFSESREAEVSGDKDVKREVRLCEEEDTCWDWEKGRGRERLRERERGRERERNSDRKIGKENLTHWSEVNFRNRWRRAVSVCVLLV